MKILGICGSLRQESWNRRLLVNTLEIADGKGAETDIFDLKGVPISTRMTKGAERRPRWRCCGRRLRLRTR